tara:strand:+ start:64 stop:273 length:210 start_codon:yes stop_codon:yes gene_type:complete
MKKIKDKIKGLNLEVDKSTKLYELNGVIDEFKKDTDDKHDVNVSLSFDISHSTLHLKRIRKPYLKLVKK